MEAVGLPEGSKADPNLINESRQPERTNTGALSQEEQKLLKEMGSGGFYHKLNVVGRARVGPGEEWQDVNANSKPEDIKRAYAVAGAFTNRASAIGGDVSAAANEEFMKLNEDMKRYGEGERFTVKHINKQPQPVSPTYHGVNNSWTMYEEFGKNKYDDLYSNKEYGGEIFTKLFWKTLGGEKLVNKTISEYDLLDERGMLGQLYGAAELKKYKEELKASYEAKLKNVSRYGLFLPAESRSGVLEEVAKVIREDDLGVEKMMLQLADEKNTALMVMEGKNEGMDKNIIMAIFVLVCLGKARPIRWTEKQKEMIEQMGEEALKKEAQKRVNMIRGGRN